MKMKPLQCTCFAFCPRSLHELCYRGYVDDIFSREKKIESYTSRFKRKTMDFSYYVFVIFLGYLTSSTCTCTVFASKRFICATVLKVGAISGIITKLPIVTKIASFHAVVLHGITLFWVFTVREKTAALWVFVNTWLKSDGSWIRSICSDWHCRLLSNWRFFCCRWVLGWWRVQFASSTRQRAFPFHVTIIASSAQFEHLAVA